MSSFVGHKYHERSHGEGLFPLLVSATVESLPILTARSSHGRAARRRWRPSWSSWRLDPIRPCLASLSCREQEFRASRAMRLREGHLGILNPLQLDVHAVVGEQQSSVSEKSSRLGEEQPSRRRAVGFGEEQWSVDGTSPDKMRREGHPGNDGFTSGRCSLRVL